MAEKVCLLTDHIPITKIPDTLKKDLFIKLILNVVEVIEKIII